MRCNWRARFDSERHYAQQPPTASGPDPLEQLKKLAELRDTGVLTEEEFQAKKAKILASALGLIISSPRFFPESCGCHT